MSEQQNQNEAAGGGSALTAQLGALADQFECHAASRSIDDVEAAGRAMREAKAEIERLRDALENLELQAVRDVVHGWVSVPAVEWDAIMVHNA